MKILITGGAGFVPSCLAERLLQKGFEVVLIDNFVTGKKSNIPSSPNVTFFERDVNIFEQISPIFEKLNNKIKLPMEERIKQFINEYMNESYIPWLWTLTELIEKNHINMFDIKLINWAEHLLNKYNIFKTGH